MIPYIPLIYRVRIAVMNSFPVHVNSIKLRGLLFQLNIVIFILVHCCINNAEF